ncbi:hypothetical protein F2P81_015191 [Scophthalmus maximus]|uniref:Uncharacterized protein n=1 Tax=Scophthalmus maximus TaxID=52904 RepID=A0A6A4SP89_SCOMX|nr:hypothetical protein F2P81_015191 [Scophthalmus maximus]
MIHGHASELMFSPHNAVYAENIHFSSAHKAAVSQKALKRPGTNSSDAEGAAVPPSFTETDETLSGADADVSQQGSGATSLCPDKHRHDQGWNPSEARSARLQRVRGRSSSSPTQMSFCTNRGEKWAALKNMLLVLGIM